MGEYYRRHLPHYQPDEAMFHVVFRLAGSLPARVVEEMRAQRERARLISTPKDDEERDLLRKLRWGYFKRFDNLLNGLASGPRWLRNRKVAEVVKEAIHYRDGKEYVLIAYTIMPSHVHMIFELLPAKTAGTVRRVDPTANENAELVRRAGCPTAEDHHTWPIRRTDCPTNEKRYPVTEILRKLKWNTALRANRILRRTGTFWQPESYDHVIRDAEELERTVWYVLQNPVTARLARSWQEWPWSFCQWDPS